MEIAFDESNENVKLVKKSTYPYRLDTHPIEDGDKVIRIRVPSDEEDLLCHIPLSERRVVIEDFENVYESEIISHQSFRTENRIHLRCSICDEEFEKGDTCFSVGVATSTPTMHKSCGPRFIETISSPWENTTELLAELI